MLWERRRLLEAALALPLVGCGRALPLAGDAVAARTDYKPGDRYTYRFMDAFSKVPERTLIHTVTRVTGEEVVYNDGSFTTDRLGNTLQNWDGRRQSRNAVYPSEFAIGKRWDTSYQVELPTRGILTLSAEMRISRRERITVPAGTFDAFRVDGRGFLNGAGFWEIGVEMTQWCTPERVRRPIAFQQIQRLFSYVGRADREELVAFQEA